MEYFDYERVAHEAGIPPHKLKALGEVVRQDFPDDEMMYELHLLRACRAVLEGRLTIDEALEPDPPVRPRRPVAVGSGGQGA